METTVPGLWEAQLPGSNGVPCRRISWGIMQAGCTRRNPRETAAGAVSRATQEVEVAMGTAAASEHK